MAGGFAKDGAVQDQIDATVEEILRFDPPLHIFTRYAYEDVELFGHHFRPGDEVFGDVFSGATFAGANALLLPIGIPWLVGRPDLILPMLAGAFLALLVDATLLYRVFDSEVYPADGLWPSGVATAEVLLAGMAELVSPPCVRGHEAERDEQPELEAVRVRARVDLAEVAAV